MNQINSKKTYYLLAAVSILYLVDEVRQKKIALAIIFLASLFTCLFYLILKRYKKMKEADRDYYICLSIIALPCAIYNYFAFHNIEQLVIYFLFIFIGIGIKILLPKQY